MKKKPKAQPTGTDITSKTERLLDGLLDEANLLSPLEKLQIISESTKFIVAKNKLKNDEEWGIAFDEEVDEDE
ncbi:MAG: hypothetical protein QXI16_00290 [Sulfolobaceae archaeon]